jgi:hypothetical protein
MTPIEMHYSWIGFVYQATAWLGQRLAEKLFDIVLVAIGTWVGYRLAKKHLEHFVTGIVNEMDAKYLNLINEMDAKYLNLINGMDAKYLNLNRDMAFERAVTVMLPELPEFYMRPTRTLSPQLAAALGDYTHWSIAIDPTHTPEKTMELVGKGAHKSAAEFIQKDMGFREEVAVPNYKWIVGIGSLPAGFAVEEVPHLTIYNWDTGVAVYRHAIMEETARTDTSIQYSWMWDRKDVPCGLYVGVVNFTIGGTIKMRRTASTVENRVRIFFKRENGQLVKAHEDVPWNDKPTDNPRC